MSKFRRNKPHPSKPKVPPPSNSTRFLLIKKNNNNRINDKNNNFGRKSKLTVSLKRNILEAIRSNMTIKRACALNNISPMIYYCWLNKGRDEAERIETKLEEVQAEAIKEGELDPADSSQVEQFISSKIKGLQPNKFFTFLISVKAVQAEAELANLDAIRRARDGGEYVAERIVEKDPSGKVVSERECTKYLTPQWTAAAWLLERMYPGRYGQRVSHEGQIDTKTHHDHRHIHVELDNSDERAAGVLEILLGTGAVTRGLLEYRQGAS